MEQVRLIEPDGTEGLITSYYDAVQWCSNNTGWSWRYLTPDEQSTLF